MEEFSEEVEDVGRGVNHRWGLRGLGVTFWEERKRWRLS